MQSTFSLATALRSSKLTPWSIASSLVPPESDPEHEASARQVIESGDLLGEHDGVVLRDEAHPRPYLQLRGDRSRGSQSDIRVKAAAVVVEPHPLDQRGRHIGVHRKVRVLR